MKSRIKIGERFVGEDYEPLVIAEIGINHEGDFEKAKKMVKDANESGAECVKFQCHIIEDEMIENDVIPPNAKESIWNMMKRCSFTEEQEILLKDFVESQGMIYLNTPFSRAAANRLEKMKICAYKIGSGECNNYPLIKHITSFGKPVILSMGMGGNRKYLEKLFSKNRKCIFCYCISDYPVKFEKIDWKKALK